MKGKLVMNNVLWCTGSTYKEMLMSILKGAICVTYVCFKCELSCLCLCVSIFPSFRLLLRPVTPDVMALVISITSQLDLLQWSTYFIIFDNPAASLLIYSQRPYRNVPCSIRRKQGGVKSKRIKKGGGERKECHNLQYNVQNFYQSQQLYLDNSVCECKSATCTT